MSKHFYTLAFLLTFHACQSQSEKVEEHRLLGGPCEGCEAIFEYGEKKLTPIDTLPAYRENEPKIKITGTVFEKDGKTPAKNVILYVYHTNRKGIYETKGDEQGWAKRHGFIRTWLQTDANGKYTFFTFRPASYPNGRAPEHIHITIKEPDKNPYYIDDFLFDDDPLLTATERKRLKNRAGSGIITLQPTENIYVAKRDIILGLNIPNYD